MTPSFLHTMVRITDPDRSRAFYEALGFAFERDMDIVRNGEKEATNSSSPWATSPRSSS
jgi:catechol 2,3-dioxygenase-like lactoylglutathione lyase family enzyme